MLPQKKVDEVFEAIEMGMHAYIHRDTYTVISLPEDEHLSGMDNPTWNADLEEVENNSSKYILIEPLAQPEEIKMRQRFTWRVADDKLSNKLFNSLNGRGAFRKFRSLLDRHPDVLDKWYEFEREFKRRHVTTLLSLRFEEE